MTRTRIVHGTSVVVTPEMGEESGAMRRTAHKMRIVVRVARTCVSGLSFVLQER